MKLLATFLLIGTVDSTDEVFATVEINMNPATNQPGHAVMPLTAFPCEIKEGDTLTNKIVSVGLQDHSNAYVDQCSM